MNDQEENNIGVTALRFASEEASNQSLDSYFKQKPSGNQLYSFASRTGKGSVAVARTEYSTEYSEKLDAIFK